MALSTSFIPEDEARAYLSQHQTEARTYDNYEDFCKDHPYFGGYWVKSPWMKQLWETLKHRGLMLWQPLHYHKITKLSELFVKADLKPYQIRMKQLDRYRRPTNEFGISERYSEWLKHSRYHRPVNGSYGGIKSWNSKHNVRQHYGGQFYHATVTPKPEFKVRELLVTGSDTRETPYFELIEWEHHTLLVLKSNLIIASRWIAVLDPGESLFDLLPIEQQRFLLSEWTTRMLEIGEW